MRWVLAGTRDGVDWRVGDGLRVLLHQLDAMWPTGTAVDGTIGDAAHAARDSDHNPRDFGYPRQIVLAADIGEHIEDQGQQLVDALVASRDMRIAYIIHEDRIWRSYDKPGIPAWTPAEYTGWNPHSGHVHLSLLRNRMLFDYTGGWSLLGVEREDTNMELAKEIQRVLANLGYYTGAIDGIFGPMSKGALTAALMSDAPHAHDIEWPPSTDVRTGPPVQID